MLFAQDEEQLPPRAVPVDPALQQDAGEDWYQRGRNLYEASKRNTNPETQQAGYARTIEILTHYLNEFPNHPNAEAAWWYLGQSYYASGRTEDAKRCYHNLLNRYSKGRFAAAAAYTLAADHFNNRQYALAATLFEKLIAIATLPADRHRGLFHAGLSYELQGRNREAMVYYRKLVADPEPVNAYLSRGQLGLGRLLAHDGKDEEALPLLEQVANSPSPADVRGEAAVEAGALAARGGHPELADKYLSMVMNTPGMEASRPEAQLTLMAYRFEQKKYQDVVNLYLRAAAGKLTGEREARRLMLAARSYMMLQKNVEALELFREVERLTLPTDDYAFEANYLRLLCFYRIEGRHVPDQVDAFLQLFRKSRPKDPKIHTALLMKAETLMAENQIAEAAKVYNDIDATLLSEENRPGFLYNRGWAQASAEDPQGAIRSLSVFLESYPKDERAPKALIQRAAAYAATGEAAKALVDYDRLIAGKADPELDGEARMRSADIAKQQNNLPDMIRRYRDFLEKAAKPTASQKAKASYWVAWGLVKTERAKDAVPYAQAARQFAPETYGKNAGALLSLCYWSLQQPDELCGEVDKAIAGGYSTDLPEQLVRWAAMQAFNADRFKQAAGFYGLIADEDQPEATPKEVWRYLGKALLAAGEPAKALAPINHALSAEEELMWKADGLLDKGQALLDLNRPAEALKVAEEGLAMRPQGRVGAGLNILRGDVFMKQGNATEAAAAYVGTVVFMDDNDKVLKPRALYKLSEALEKKGDKAEAEKYRQERLRKYPNWQPAK